MTTFAVAFKEHVRRLARKEIRQQTGVLRRASSQHRRDLAALKRTIAALQREVRRAASGSAPAAAKADGDPALDGARFSARSVRAQRKRLGLSAADFGKLAGVSALTIYHWESGKARPRAKALGGFLSIRGITKREAYDRLGLKDSDLGRRGRRRGRPPGRKPGRKAAR